MKDLALRVNSAKDLDSPDSSVRPNGLLQNDKAVNGFKMLNKHRSFALRAQDDNGVNSYSSSGT